MDLKGFLKESRVSQVELSRVFGCSPGNVSNIVTGKRNLTETQVRRLADQYGLDAVSRFATPAEMKFLRPASSPVPSGISGDNNVQVGGNASNVNASGALTMALAEIAKAHDLMDKIQSESVRCTTKMQEQMDRLISIIEQHQKQ